MQERSFLSRLLGTISLDRQDNINKNILRLVAMMMIVILVSCVVMLFVQAWPAAKTFGWTFLVDDWWNPVEDHFGGLAFIYGTVVTSFFALLISAPTSVMVALFLNEVLPPKGSQIVGTFVEMIAAVPSIVFGLWGIFNLAPWVKNSLTPVLKGLFGSTPLFPEDGASFGIGILSASLILAVMITPTICSICREVFKTIPRIQKEAALALGSTPFECMKIAILRPSVPGIVGAMTLGLGRALGETMAVAMVIGNNPQIKASLFESGATMASVLANEYAEADGDLHLSALCLVGLLLFLITLITNILARGIVWRYRKKHGGNLV